MTSCMITITFLGLQITKADVEELDSNDHPPCICYKVSLAQEQKGLFTLTATGVEEAGVGLLNIPITVHFDVPAVHQVCHFNIAMSCNTYLMLFQGKTVQ